MFDPNNITFLQAAFEARFQSNLFVLERRNAEKLNKKIKDVFPMRGQYSEKLLSFTNQYKVQANIGLGNITLQMEEPTDLEQFAGYVNKFVPNATAIFDIPKFIRFGFKLSTIWLTGSLEEANQCYFDLTKIDKNNIDEIGSVIGFSSNVILKSDDVTINIAINPAIQQKIEMNLTAGSTNTIKYGLMVTSDFAIDGLLNDGRIEDFTKRAVDSFHTKVIKFLNSVV
jgi:hypothetical protein